MTARAARDAVKATAAGRWLAILEALAPDLGPALARPGRHVACPRHGGRDGFRLFRDGAETGGGGCNTCGLHGDGFALLQWLHGWTFPEALAAVARSLGLDHGTAVPVRPRAVARPIPASPVEVPGRRAALARLWTEAVPTHPRLVRYLRSRGLSGAVPESIRFHARLAYHDDRGRLVGHFPAMLARVERLNGELVALHRTYLDPAGDGKVAIPDPDAPGGRLSAKKLTPAVREGATRGAAIRLAEPVPGGTLALAEGIETALTVQEATGTPTWATVSAGGLAAVEVPCVVPAIELWADRDATGVGEQAARAAAGRLRAADHRVVIFLPPDAARHA